MNHHQRLQWMQRACELARYARQQDEVPVGAVVVYQGAVIGEGWNQPRLSCDSSAHAEIMAIREAGKALNNYRLPGADIYVTLEPCAMCVGAIIHARLSSLFYAVTDPKTGACGGAFNLIQDHAHNHHVQTRQGLMEDECRQLIQSFFRERRVRACTK